MTYHTSEAIGDVLVIWITVPRIVNDLVAFGFKTEILAALDTNVLPKMLLHFGGVATLSSALIGALIVLHKKCQGRVWLKLCSLSAEVREPLAITGLDRLFEIHHDQEDALAAFGQDRR